MISGNFRKLASAVAAMPSARRKPLPAYRRRLRRRGVVRVEVLVRKDDAALVRGVARALADPSRESEARALLRERFGAGKGKGLKALLAAAPLEGIDLSRARRRAGGRAVNYLIDTNIICEVRQGAECDPRVAAWYESIDDASIYLSVLVLGEIRKGAERARRNNPHQAGAVENWLAAMVRSFADRILPIDLAVTDEWGRMSARRPVSTIDALLAATARVHRMTLATRNVADVIDLCAKVLNPFEPAA